MPIEKLSSELDRLVPGDQEVEELATGFGGVNGPAEGPLWWHEGGYLLFSDIHNNRRMKWSPGEGVSLFQQPTNHANGLTRDLKGRLVACEHSSGESRARTLTARSRSSPTAIEAPTEPTQRRGGEVRRQCVLHQSRRARTRS